MAGSSKNFQQKSVFLLPLNKLNEFDKYAKKFAYFLINKTSTSTPMGQHACFVLVVN
ncbi:conserved domain protein [Mycoplasmoides pneumoniae FH]|uniref:Conserved domain protein n=1 Tax=Mycoplasmoides pneumoniae (strain ATCC 15531 / DSM 23978 / CIP 103766 / NBRC 14401 / NCTC 10119 / FH) TaxID=722438 RepID=A0A0H3DLN4_MYCPB|nr:conserved domain protein [Mycoplasmoides pneumoniae FH]